jgi:hypothetical protein
MEKKMKAKSDMLKMLSKEMSDDQYSPLKDQLAGKKLSKVTVMADSKKGLEKGLSKAEEILKKREELMGSSSESESDDSEEESCEGCEEGCPMCESSDEESESESEDMSKEEIMDMMKSLEAKLAKMK